MTEPIIEAHGLGKRYTLGAIGAKTLREAAERTWLRILGRGASPGDGEPDIGKPREKGGSRSFWALKDVSFHVNEGEILGIVGRNGAGKSTLLKILSRITEPTEGRALLRGRVASILEVGTGFHPELTGRDNIMLNGAMLGMKRSETRRKFDEIVDFAEVGAFLDTPVKRYSSGMYVRLAFAVAAHLEPEILIVDEVLAVGDAAFQKKCLGKMSEVSHQGRTVLFVSHNMDAVRRLCSRCILLADGRVEMEGNQIEVTSQYLVRSLDQTAPNRWIDLSGAKREGSGGARVTALRYRGISPDSLPATNRPFEVELGVESGMEGSVRCCTLWISDSQGNRLVIVETASHGHELKIVKGKNLIRISIAHLYLNPGTYILGYWLGRTIEDETALDTIDSAASVEVVELSPSGFSYPWAVGPVSCDFTIRTIDPKGATTPAEPAGGTSVRWSSV